MNSDNDHLHMLVSMKPSISVSQIVRVLKQESTVLYLEEIQAVSKEAFLERTYFLVRWLLCSKHREC